MTDSFPLHPARRPTRSARATSGRLIRVASVAVLIAVTSACEVSGSLTSPTTGYSGTTRSGPTEPAIDPALAGVWQHKVWFTDSRGRSYLSETTWSFRGDGTATRIVVAVAFDDGVSDRFVSNARWRAANRTLEIEWLPPRIGLTRLHYQVDGRTARIGGDVYLRID